MKVRLRRQTDSDWGYNMNLTEIRQQYPEYSHVDDKTLADALYKKYYSHADRAEFDRRIGYKPEKPSAAQAIGQDIKEGITQIPSDLMNFARALPGELYGAGKQALTEPKRALQNVGGGFGELGHGILSTPGNIRDYLVKRGVAGEDSPSFRLPESILPRDYNYAEALGREGQKPGDVLLGSLPAAAAFGPAGELGELGALARAGSRAASAGTYAVGQNENPLTAALMQSILGGTAKGISKLPGVAPSRALRGTLSPEELARNLEVTQGTNTNLGRVIDSPTLSKFYENVLPGIIGAGAEDTMQQTAKGITQKATDLVTRLQEEGAHPADYGIKIQDALKDAASQVQKTKREKFGVVNRLAEEHGVKTDRSGFRQAAKDALAQIKSDEDLASFRDTADMKLLQDIANRKKGEFSLKESDYLRSELGERAHDAYIKGDTPKSNLFKRMKESLDEDIKSAIDQSPNADLKKARDEAMDYYRKEVVPFEDRDIVKFTRKGGDPDLILNHFVRGGRLDRGTLLNKLNESISRQSTPTPNLLSSAYLSQAVDETGQVSPLKLRALYNKLGHNQRKSLFGDESLHKEVRDLVDLTGKNAEAFSLMANPKTGARNTAILTNLITGGAGGTLGGIPGVVGATALSGVLGRGATKLLSSPKVREKLVNKMIKNEGKLSRKDRKLADKIGRAMLPAEVQTNRKPLELLLEKSR